MENNEKGFGSVDDQEMIKELLDNLGGLRVTKVVFDNGNVLNTNLIVPQKDKGTEEKYLFLFADKDIIPKLEKKVVETKNNIFRYGVLVHLPEIASIAYINNRLRKPQI
ncbi:MAG TPA: hypothetical protein PLE28_01575 [bacterium]|nr:hypothetical protein [bacterium]